MLLLSWYPVYVYWYNTYDWGREFKFNSGVPRVSYRLGKLGILIYK